MPPRDRRASDHLAAPARPRPAAPNSEALRRRVYLLATLLGSAVLIVVWLMQVRRPAPELYVLYGHPLLLLQCVWIVWWLLRGRPLMVAERVVFVVNALALLAQNLLAVVTDPQALLSLTSAAYWMLVAISVLSFLIFNNRQALLFTAAAYLLGVGLPWGALLVRGDPLGGHAELARVQLTCGVVLALLSVLAWYRERFALERGQRLSLEHLANTDPLTGLPNRRALYPEIERLLAGVRAGTAGSLILLDVDHFKRVNDTFGHNAGDEVLTRLASLLRASLRGSDAAGRWGGEEFLITLPGLPAEVGAQVAERLRRQVAREVSVQGRPVTASFGVTGCTDADDMVSCIARADRALYAAKTAGRDRVVSAAGPAREEEDGAVLPPLTLAE